VTFRLTIWTVTFLCALHFAVRGNERVSLRDVRRNHTAFTGMRDAHGVARIFRAGVILTRFKDAPRTEGVVVPRNREIAMLQTLKTRPDVAYAELDVVLARQFQPNDPGLGEQWHHQTIHSESAWSYSLATHKITLAILDTPFQMNHPDLAANTVPGWDMTTQQPVTAAPEGYYHSTIGAGMAAAAINNLTGVSGVANCWLMPVNIGDSPTTSDMHDSVIWAADHGARVVNLSWDGAFSSVINEAGAYLKEKMRGMLFMSGVNGRKLLDYPKQPDIYAISMTDQQDEPRAAYGDHIDFAAPGWQVYSTTTNSTYEVDSGTSYSAPLVAGIAAWVMSVNPELGPTEIEQILKDSSIDLGAPGWDQDFGWGRIDFGKAALLTFATLPVSRIGVVQSTPFAVRAVYREGASYRLLRSSTLSNPEWQVVQDAAITVADGTVTLTDPAPTGVQGFYRVEITLPRE
jgi:subtilisin family serine protease